MATMKMVILDEKLKSPKTHEKHVKTTLRTYQSCPMQKTARKNFENWKKWPLCKGYSLCKMVSLDER